MGGFNLSQIVNKQLNVQEQNSYGLVFVPPIDKVSFITSGWGMGHYAQLSAGFKNISSTTQGGYIHFRFTGRRIGVLLAKMKGYGVLSFDIDGTDYGQYDTSFADWYQGVTSINYNVPHIIATDLPEGEHLLTITKVDNLNTSLQGFLVDDASYAQPQANFNYHVMLDSAGTANVPTSVATTGTIIRATNTWIMCATFTNTTASVINITLKDGNGNSMVGPFPIPANDIRQITGPLYLGGTSKAYASATGVNMTIGGQ